MMNNLLICLVIMAAIGVLLCFFGRRFINISLPLVAFVIVMRYVIEHFGASQYALLIALLAGVAGALLARFAKRAAFFIVGCLVGYYLGSLLCRYISLPNIYSQYAVMIMSALILGFLFVKWNNFFISVITAYAGGQRLACLSVFMATQYASLASYGKADLLATFQSLENYLENGFAQTYPVYILLVTIIFLLIGISVQNRYHGHYRRR